MPRLRTVSPSQPGITRLRHGRGFRYVDKGEKVTDAVVLQRIREPGHPARVARRVDLPLGHRPHPGRRHRRQGPAAVPVPPAVAHPARRA
ncbi:hypothetical protein GCM10025868_26890 [Angustibacter aerolatus]|uniref:Uncharacterized protein n=1 Tax=Angustibacter aerolatus TaxID=1162965 RepID=A0ABQ6JJZ1_9ACTN|nr:hypothetical protein [Angustibacter aerolatus]GMA87439.1 hypothetical protein GCM10025868_26890 [Angustibacter aerolatus]